MPRFLRAAVEGLSMFFGKTPGCTGLAFPGTLASYLVCGFACSGFAQQPGMCLSHVACAALAAHADICS